MPRVRSPPYASPLRLLWPMRHPFVSRPHSMQLRYNRSRAHRTKSSCPRSQHLKETCNRISPGEPHETGTGGHAYGLRPHGLCETDRVGSWTAGAVNFSGCRPSARTDLSNRRRIRHLPVWG